MIIVQEVRWCLTCSRMETHDVEYHAKRGKKIEHAYTCRTCHKRRLVPHLSRAAQQNGGGGDMRYRARRARL